ncbi:MAG: competence/damage-inducible protein A [Crocinitomicaceae bacterium]|nr:competence/damage-inducible protein A [Crocinitomicaceae bacterium]
MNAELITIGDELLIGQTVDTNGSWIGEQLNLLGIKVTQISSIRDDREHIISSLNVALNRSDLVILTGGLGPTNDDITKTTLCEFFESQLVLNKQVLQKIETYFKSSGLKMLKVNSDQAMLPNNCEPLRNDRGTACGMWFKKNGVDFISLPGVPYEMKGIFLEEILPKLKTQYLTSNVVNKTIKTQGIGESFLAEIIKDWETELVSSGLKLAYLPSPGIVKLRITGFGNNENELAKKIDGFINQLKSLIPNYIFGYEKDRLEEVVGELLKSSGSSLSLAESCTGGNIAHLITAISGSSAYYKGSVVAYSNEIKEQLLNVSPNLIKNNGAVSKEVVEQMAIGVKNAFNTDYAIATSGIAGPSGGTKQKPVGTVWIAVANKEKVISKKFSLGNNRERNILISSLSALNMLRLMLLN